MYSYVYVSFGMACYWEIVSCVQPPVVTGVLLNFFDMGETQSPQWPQLQRGADPPLRRISAIDDLFVASGR